ncbi:hypothetical protein NPIL_684801 [Nephila pilipes]|uniref:Uncharacterized protein n=1 Tax=Nephila pilipes TaxID=299642 RepID=A0A8X6TN93_NEPPI|nr:hypothetical protein NPIL_684801 [Nephila pilipes]
MITCDTCFSQHHLLVITDADTGVDRERQKETQIRPPPTTIITYGLAISFLLLELMILCSEKHSPDFSRWHQLIEREQRGTFLGMNPVMTLNETLRLLERSDASFVRYDFNQ